MSRLPQAPSRVLVVSLRFLGDALLSTPLAAAAKRQWPDCAVDMLVFRGCEGILEGNPDIDQVLTVEHKPGKREQLRQLRELWNRYDLAFITQSGTRPFLYGWAAGRRAVAPVAPERGKSFWKSALLWRAVREQTTSARMTENARLLEAVGIDESPAPVPPTCGLDLQALSTLIGQTLEPRYTVIHPSPRWRYKRWTDAGWRELIRHLRAEGMQVVVTGGPGEAERTYLEQVLSGVTDAGVLALPGRLSLAQTADLIAGACAFAGVDTATTHLAAASGTPTVAIFGPTDPAIWGPWPSCGGQPYERHESPQVRGGVTLIQNTTFACVPCQGEGCERRVDSASLCLDELAPGIIIAAVDARIATQDSGRAD